MCNHLHQLSDLELFWGLYVGLMLINVFNVYVCNLAEKKEVQLIIVSVLKVFSYLSECRLFVLSILIGPSALALSRGSCLVIHQEDQSSQSVTKWAKQNS